MLFTVAEELETLVLPVMFKLLMVLLRADDDWLVVMLLTCAPLEELELLEE